MKRLNSQTAYFQTAIVLFSMFVFLSTLAVAEAFQPRVKLKENPRRVELLRKGDVCKAQPQAGSLERIVALSRREWVAFERPIFDIAAKLPTDLPPELNEPDMKTLEKPAISPRLLRAGFKEDVGKIRARIGSYWAVVPEAEDTYFSAQNKIWNIRKHAGWVDAWSAAFISYILCEAGVPQEEFPRSASHIDYVKHVVGGHSQTWRALSLKQAGRLKVGDIACADRGGAPNMTKKTILQQEWRPLHCDIVVGHGQGHRVKMIGGNVKDAVTMTVARLVDDQLEVTNHRRWFVVLRRK